MHITLDDNNNKNVLLIFNFGNFDGLTRYNLKSQTPTAKRLNNSVCYSKQNTSENICQLCVCLHEFCMINMPSCVHRIQWIHADTTIRNSIRANLITKQKFPLAHEQKAKKAHRRFMYPLCRCSLSRFVVFCFCRSWLCIPYILAIICSEFSGSLSCCASLCI